MINIINVKCQPVHKYVQLQTRCYNDADSVQILRIVAHLIQRFFGDLREAAFYLEVFAHREFPHVSH